MFVILIYTDRYLNVIYKNFISIQFYYYSVDWLNN